MSKVVEIAQKYIGQKETINNSGFKDSDFEDRMEKCGWKPGQAWCAYFAELVWKEAYPDKQDLDKLFSGGAVATYTNFAKDSDYIVDKIPEPGAVVIWQYYRNSVPQWTGHAGIVISSDGLNIYTVEGNTNAQGGREGIEVAQKFRSLDFVPKQHGLVLKGFIKPKP